MAAGWSKNEIVAAKRRCGMVIRKTDGSQAPRGTDFMALGYVFICGATAPHFAVALGTLTNQRRPLVVADDVVESADTGSNELTLTDHDYETGDGPFVADEPMGSLMIGTEFWTIVTGADTIQIATSLANAYAGTAVALLGTEDGATISDKATTQRGIDGLFEYEATQAETDHDAPETVVIVHGDPDYDIDAFAGAYVTNTMQTSAASAFEQLSENGETYGDQVRLCRRTLASKFTKSGNDYTFRDAADTKDSHSGTVTSAGRIAATIIDPT